MFKFEFDSSRKIIEWVTLFNIKCARLNIFVDL